MFRNISLPTVNLSGDMSSSEDDYGDHSVKKKRKTVRRACDTCRRKKMRCDEPKPPHNKCTVCLEYDADCTFEDVRKKRGRPKGYVERLEKRVRLLERLLEKVFPDPTVLEGMLSSLESENVDNLTVPIPENLALSPSTISSSPTPSDSLSKNVVVDLLHKVVALTLGSNDDPFREDDQEHIALSERLKKLSLSSDTQFWGKSSGVVFVQTAIMLKNEFAKDIPVKRDLFHSRRIEFWKRPEWEKDKPTPKLQFEFPPPDLMTKLIDAYFKHINLFLPLLHRPTFERSVANSLHSHDEGFASIVLLVCAVGARLTDEIDKRVLLDGETSPYSAGWKYYNQVQVIKSSIMGAPTLYDLQIYCLAINFLHGCYAQKALWIIVGFGIRLAQDVGIHRYRVPREKLTVEDELWKRAFWVLVTLDRVTSMGMGRPCAIFDDHFDLDMPIECDDEYWEHPDPEKRFKQPEGLPCTISAFNQQLRLEKIMSFALNTVYSIRAKFWEFVFPEWEQHLVAELDSALNNWLSSLPTFLRWDPNITDDRFFRLSGSLITRYYNVQILIHRPYIRAKGKPTALAVSSLAICRSASRSCSLVLEEQLKRTDEIVYQYMQMSAVPAAIMLLLNMWGSKRSLGSSFTDPKVMVLVETCLNVMKKAEVRWRSAGMLYDILNELANVGELILPDPFGPDVHRDQRYANAQAQQIISPAPIGLPTGPPSHQLMEPPLDINDLFTSNNSSSRRLPEIPFTFTELSGLTRRSFVESSERSLPFPPENVLQNEPIQSGPQYIPPENTADVGDMSSFVNDGLDPNFGSSVRQEQGFTDEMWFNGPNAFQLNEWNLFLENFAQVYDSQPTYGDTNYSQSF